MTLKGAIQIADLAEGESFDVVVIGAGPAGAAAATQLARDGFQTLLVDKQEFPRDKVCGSCLSGQAVAALERMGMEQSLNQSISLTEFVLTTGRRQVRLACQGGRAISRRKFDWELARIAIDAGAGFLPTTLAAPAQTHDRYREIKLSSAGQERRVRCRLAVVCAGLGKVGEKTWGLPERVAPKSRIGLTTYTGNPGGFRPGSIYMCVNRAGYLGITALEDGRLNLSACVDRNTFRSFSVNQMAQELIRLSGLEAPLSKKQRWMGTPELSRQLLCPASHRLLVLGDAAGYAEPFTGQGIAWALAAVEDIRDVAARAVGRWETSLIRLWQTKTRRRQRTQQRVCNFTKWLARWPLAMETTVGLLRIFPSLASPFIGAIHKA